VYFGYQAIWTFTFIPAAFVLVMTVSIALALIYAVGSRGKAAVERYLRIWTIVFLTAGAADVAYGLLSGQLGGFVSVYGIVPLLEMTVLAFMCVGAMWIMAASYVGSKKE